MTTTYSSKSTAERGAKRAIAKCSDALIVSGLVSEQATNGWFVTVMVDQSMGSVPLADLEALSGFNVETDPEGSYVKVQVTKLEADAEGEQISDETKKRARSEYGKGASKRVWAIADSMPGKARKDVIAAAVAEGINVGTAKTQYQHWKKATGN